MDISLGILYVFIFLGLYIQLFLLLTFFESETPPKEEMNDADLPTVSITVPCFNEEKTLAKTVNSLLALNYPKKKLSILIVDDGSTDGTLSVAKQFAGDMVTVVSQKNGGKFTALNHGIRISTAEFVTCLDADSEVHPDALRRMIPYFKDKKVAAVTPAIIVHNPKNLLQIMQKVEYQIGVFTKWIHGAMNAIYVTPGPFSIFRREIFETIGYFRHAHNTEDMEIACRIQKHGYKITNCSTALVYTITPDTLKKLHRQRVRWVYGFINNIRDYKELFFRLQYGNLGVLVFPFGLISITSSLYIFGTVIYHTIDSIVQKIYQWSVVGFHPRFYFSFDWFYINTDSYLFLSIVVLLCSLSIILIGRKMSEGHARPSMDIVYFSFFYGFLASIWLSKAVYNVVLAKKAPWR